MITCGFYDSIKADRRYDAHQISQMFMGVIPDGICAGIGNGFACERKDKHTIKIRSGFGYFNGYYIYNDEEIEYTIPETAYPEPGISAIYVETPPIQTEYPAGNPIDLEGISVKGIKSQMRVVAIRVETPPQSNYPEGNAFDLGSVKVVGELEPVDGDDERVGDCYIVIEFQEAERKFVIQAINVNDFRSSIHHLIAICHKSSEMLRVENVVGKTVGDIPQTKWITGLFQDILIDDILGTFSYEEEAFRESFLNDKSDYWTDWLNNNEYILHHQEGISQYNRMVNELATKEDKPIIISDRIPKGTTTFDIYVTNMPTDPKISFKNDPFGLVITGMTVYNTYIRVSYITAIRDYSILLVVR